MTDETQGGFQVTDEQEVADLTETKEQRSIMPVVKALKVRIAKGEVASNANPKEGKVADIKGLKLEVRVVEGVETHDQETGEVSFKYVNKPLFTGLMDLVFWADLEVVGTKGKNAGKARKDVDWWKNDQHRVEFKKFLTALDLPLKGLKINDEFFANLSGREVLVDIQHEKEQVLNPETGAYVDTGRLSERLKNWKKAA